MTAWESPLRLIRPPHCVKVDPSPSSSTAVVKVYGWTSARSDMARREHQE
jgi:hypothetical protein